MVEAVLSLTMAGSRQHVAVIKSKETIERDVGENKKNICVDFARIKKREILAVVKKNQMVSK